MFTTTYSLLISNKLAHAARLGLDDEIAVHRSKLEPQDVRYFNTCLVCGNISLAHNLFKVPGIVLTYLAFECRVIRSRAVLASGTPG